MACLNVCNMNEFTMFSYYHIDVDTMQMASNPVKIESLLQEIKLLFGNNELLVFKVPKS